MYLGIEVDHNRAPRCSTPARHDDNTDTRSPSASTSTATRRVRRRHDRLDGAATKELDRVGFDARLRELVRLRASQLNGCAYCVDMHTKDARAAGETEQRLALLAVWRETALFTPRERAALALTESVTLVAQRRTSRTPIRRGRGALHARTSSARWSA